MGKIITVENKVIDVIPQNGETFSIEELEDIVAGTISIMPCRDEFMVMNSKGLYFDLPLNEIASKLYCEKNKLNNLKILGHVLVVPKNELGEYKKEE